MCRPCGRCCKSNIFNLTEMKTIFFTVGLVVILVGITFGIFQHQRQQPITQRVPQSSPSPVSFAEARLSILDEQVLYESWINTRGYPPGRPRLVWQRHEYRAVALGHHHQITYVPATSPPYSLVSRSRLAGLQVRFDPWSRCVTKTGQRPERSCAHPEWAVWRAPHARQRRHTPNTMCKISCTRSY
jgi:hypothetical protein